MNIENSLAKLVDDAGFAELNRLRNKFNLFEAIGGARAELRHSNFLAFLLSPTKLHGLGARPLQVFLRKVIDLANEQKRAIPVRALEIVVGDLDDTIVFRELDHIDILLEIPALKLILVIENKIGAKAGKDQLAKYKVKADERYKHWKRLFVFLTPDGNDPDHAEYVAVSYADVATMVESLVTETGLSYGEDIRLILKHYCEMLRRNIVEDEKLAELAIKLYERNKDAIDFIFKHRPEPVNLLSHAQTLLDATDLIQDRHISALLRFAPAAWDNCTNLHKCPKDKWTKTGRNVLFEIKSFKSQGEFTDRILLSLILGPCHQALRQHIFDGAARNPNVFSNCQSISPVWVTIFSRELLSETAAEAMGLTQKQETITANWNDFLAHQLPTLSQEILHLANTAPN